MSDYKSLRTVIFEVQEKSAHKPGDTWKTAGGKWGAKNKDGNVDYFEDEDSAKAWVSGKYAPAGRADKPGDTSTPVELDADGYERKPEAKGAAKPDGKSTTSAAPAGQASQPKAAAPEAERGTQPQSGGSGAEKEEHPEVGKANPKTEFDAHITPDPKATAKAKAKPDIRKANVVGKAVKAGDLDGPQTDAESVFGDAAAEQRFVEEMNHAALSAMRGEAAYDFELCSEVFAHLGLCFDPKTKQKVSKGIPRDQMPQFSSKVDSSRTDSPAFRALMRSKGYTSPDQVTPKDLEDEVNMEREYRQALEDAGYDVSDEEVSVTSLKPIQGQLKGEKIAAMYGSLAAAQADPENYGKAAARLLEPIYVSDGYVIDGHHRWAAQVAIDIANGAGANATMKTRTITRGGKPVPIEEIIEFSNKFQKDIGLLSQTRGGETIAAKKPTQKEWAMSNFRSGRIGRIAQSLHESVQARLEEGAVKAAVENWYESLPKDAVQEIYRYRKYAAFGRAREGEVPPAYRSVLGGNSVELITSILRNHRVKPGFFGTLKKAAEHIKNGGYEDFMVPFFDLQERVVGLGRPKRGKSKSGKIVHDPDSKFRGAMKPLTGYTPKPAKEKKAEPQTNVASKIFTAQDLINTALSKKTGTTIEFFGTRGGGEYSIKLKVAMKNGTPVLVTAAGKPVKLEAGSQGLRVIEDNPFAKSPRVLMDNGVDMIWESSDWVDVGMISINEIRKLSRDELAQFDAQQRKKVMAAKDKAINDRAKAAKRAKDRT